MSGWGRLVGTVGREETNRTPDEGPGPWTSDWPGLATGDDGTGGRDQSESADQPAPIPETFWQGTQQSERKECVAHNYSPIIYTTLRRDWTTGLDKAVVAHDGCGGATPIVYVRTYGYAASTAPPVHDRCYCYAAVCAAVVEVVGRRRCGRVRTLSACARTCRSVILVLLLLLLLLTDD